MIITENQLDEWVRQNSREAEAWSLSWSFG